VSRRATAHLDEFYIALFRGMLKARALRRLIENQEKTREEENKYKNINENKRWERLRQIIDKDKQLAEAESELGTLILREIMFQSTLESDPSDLNLRMSSLEDQKRYEKEREKALSARNTLRREYPALAVIDPDEVEQATTNDELLKMISDGFAEVREAIDDVYTRIHEDDIPLTKLGPIVDEVLETMGVAEEKRQQGDTMSAIVLEWLEKQERTEAMINMLIFGVTAALTVAAFVASGGTAFLLGIAGAAFGLGTAAYEFERAEDLYAAARAGKVGTQLVSDPEEARFNYIMGWVNLVLAGLDVAIAAKAGTTMLKGAAAAERLTGRVGAEILSELDPAAIARFDEAMQLRRAGKAKEADQILAKLRDELGDDAFNKANDFFERAALSADTERVSATVTEEALEQRALGKTATEAAGHELMLDASGVIYRCSDTCTNLWLQYGHILGRDEYKHFQQTLRDLERRGRIAKFSKDPVAAKQILEDAKDLEAKLRYIDEGGEIQKLKSAEELLEERGFVHDMGVKHGRSYAQKAGLKDAGFKNPFEHIGSHGQGFDDIMLDGTDLDTGIIYIVEYKGGAAGLRPGQMELAWVLQNIKRLATEGGTDGKKWADILLRAFREGRLKGVAYSTPLKGGAVQPTKVIGAWEYTP
jgi:hypothetical protein